MNVMAPKVTNSVAKFLHGGEESSANMPGKVLSQLPQIIKITYITMVLSSVTYFTGRNTEGRTKNVSRTVYI
jgi:hypothetical protein